MLAAVGIVRELSSWEASATRDSVLMEFSGTLRWRVAKNVIQFGLALFGAHLVLGLCKWSIACVGKRRLGCCWVV